MPNSNLSALDNLTEAQVHAISHELLQRVISRNHGETAAAHDSHSSGHSKNSIAMDARHLAERNVNVAHAATPGK